MLSSKRTLRLVVDVRRTDTGDVARGMTSVACKGVLVAWYKNQRTLRYGNSCKCDLAECKAEDIGDHRAAASNVISGSAGKFPE